MNTCVLKEEEKTHIYLHALMHTQKPTIHNTYSLSLSLSLSRSLARSLARLVRLVGISPCHFYLGSLETHTNSNTKHNAVCERGDAFCQCLLSNFFYFPSVHSFKSTSNDTCMSSLIWFYKEGKCCPIFDDPAAVWLALWAKHQIWPQIGTNAPNRLIMKGAGLSFYFPSFFSPLSSFLDLLFWNRTRPRAFMLPCVWIYSV